MKDIIISVDTDDKEAKKMLVFLSKNGLFKIDDYPYSEEFEKMILEAEKEIKAGKTKRFKASEIWQSII